MSGVIVAPLAFSKVASTSAFSLGYLGLPAANEPILNSGLPPIPWVENVSVPM